MVLTVDFENGPRARLSDKLVGRACELFGLQQPSSVQDLGGAFNLNVSLEVPTGSYVLRVYRPWVTMERARVIQLTREALADRGIPVARPIALATTADLGFGEDRIVELEECIPHDSAAETWEMHIKAFGLLAQLHNGLAEVCDSTPHVEATVDNYATPHEMSSWIDATASALTSRSTELKVRDAVDGLRAAYEFVQGLVPEWEEIRKELPRCVVHGDFNCATNVLIKKEDIAGILDFDLMSRHERLFDLAYAAYFSVGCIGWAPELENRSWSRVPELLQAYTAQAEVPLSEAELDYFATEMARVSLFWLSTVGYMPDSVAAFEEQRGAIEDAQWLLANLSEQMGDLWSLVSA